MEYQDTNERFYITNDDYSRSYGNQQFYRQYNVRYRTFQSLCLKQAQKVYGPNLSYTSLGHVKPGVSTYVDGIVVKISANHQSISAVEFPIPWIVPVVDDVKSMEYDARSKASPRDTLWIENDVHRIQIDGDEVVTDKLVGGYVVGLYGHKSPETFVFVVERLFFPEMAPQVPWPIGEREVYLLFISGIGLNSEVEKNVETYAAFNQLVDWLDTDDGKKINRVVVAGNTLDISGGDIKLGQLTKNGLSRNIDIKAIDQADRTLEELAKTVEVDLMSGPTDLCPIMLPQQPMISAVFQCCKKTKKFRTLTNPHSFTVNGVHFLGTSGQNLDDLHKHTRACTSVELMMQTLRGRIITPTTPNSVDGWPFHDRDPQILDELPHVYFASNQPEYLSEMVEFENGSRTHLLTIPIFREKFQAVIFNLRSMSTQLLNFSQMSS
ncbi:hypothetical protein M3Y98_00697100 [Aphelenchoides besseyi]|nr:hypothetical protein M3Y98_00697100 [Aphelenchoides besseyi]KAI6208931.1 hypothetical protein M3Y96_00167200 [Aphelenchoides besseyi]